jgi:hypothetical protein
MKSFIVGLFAASLCVGSMVYGAPPQDNDFSTGSDTQGIYLKSGVFAPIVSAGVSLGSSANRFSALYLTGNITMTGDMAITGSVTVSGTVTSKTSLGFRQFQAVSVSSGTSIPVAGTYNILDSTGATITMATDKPIFSVTGRTTGDYLVVISTDQSIIISSATYALSKIKTLALATEITKGQKMEFLFDGTYWVQVSSAVGSLTSF